MIKHWTWPVVLPHAKAFAFLLKRVLTAPLADVLHVMLLESLSQALNAL